jgi:hypothetical protein
MSYNQKEMLEQQKDMSDYQHTLANSLSMEFAMLHDKTHEIATSMSEEFSSLHVKSHVIADSLGTLQEKSHVIADSLGNLQEKSHIIADSLAKEFSSLHEKSHEIAQSLTTEFSSLHGITQQIGNGVQRQVSPLEFFSFYHISCLQVHASFILTMLFTNNCFHDTLTCWQGVVIEQVSTELHNWSFCRSLTGQRALLDGQVQAGEGLHHLKQLQESAFEESRASVLALTREAKMHQQEFLAWQTKLHTMHEQLTRGSNAMLEAQVIFCSYHLCSWWHNNGVTSVDLSMFVNNYVLYFLVLNETFIEFVKSSSTLISIVVDACRSHLCQNKQQCLHRLRGYSLYTIQSSWNPGLWRPFSFMLQLLFLSTWALVRNRPTMLALFFIAVCSFTPLVASGPFPTKICLFFMVTVFC